MGHCAIFDPVRSGSLRAARSAAIAPLRPAFALLNQGHCLRSKDLIRAPGAASRDVWSRMRPCRGPWPRWRRPVAFDPPGSDSNGSKGRIYFALQHNPRGVGGSPIACTPMRIVGTRWQRSAASRTSLTTYFYGPSPLLSFADHFEYTSRYRIGAR